MTFHMFGLRGEPLSGPESRALRSLLNLERRHVTALANALGFFKREVTTSDVTMWERSKTHGYPEALTTALDQILTAVRNAGDVLAAQACTTAAANKDEVAAIRRPLGARRVVGLLDLPAEGLVFSAAGMAILDTADGDFWQALADAMTNYAVFSIRDDESNPFWMGPVRIVLDREPG
ncbi:hypothetical protein V7S57_02550 [Caulobacter sp. CCNWLY153]|uniref:hypothetical protein n=1 Tax=unclassified Caulobacter TaxID=2648921 RepID=UPI002FF33776